MYHAIYATRDTTLYEKNFRRNAGIDQVLELIKYCKTAEFYDQLLFSPNAQKGCIAAFKKYGAIG